MLLVIGALGALAPLPAQASWMVPPPPYRPKDFTLVKHDGLYHLFYIRRNTVVPLEESESDFGHAVSKDLWIWSQLPGVLPVRPGMFDETHVWAPSIVEQDGIFYLFYTGVSDVPGQTNAYQRTGVAISTDLLEWNRLDVPVLSCADVPWTWCDSLDANTGFRDPFVMADPANPGQWLMYTSTFPGSDHDGMVVGTARSPGDLTQWADLGPLWITHRSFTSNTQVESAHLFEHAGLWYLMYTTNSGQPLTFSTGPDPLGAPSTWTYRGRLATMLGVNTFAWFASEHLSDGLVDYFSYVVADRIETYRMEWGPDWRFSLVQPSFSHVYAMAFDSSSVAETDSVTLSLSATDWSNRTVAIEALWTDTLGVEHVVPASSLGLPDTVTYDADTTRVRWAARRPDTTATAPVPVRVRLADRTATTGALAVGPPPPPPPPPPPYPPQDPDLPVEPVEDRASGNDLRVRPLSRGPFGIATPTLLVELDAAADVRLDVFDLQGRHVRNLAARRFPAGASLVDWDRRDRAGLAVRPGVYFARLVAGARARTVRIALTTR